MSFNVQNIEVLPAVINETEYKKYQKNLYLKNNISMRGLLEHYNKGKKIGKGVDGDVYSVSRNNLSYVIKIVKSTDKEYKLLENTSNINNIPLDKISIPYINIWQEYEIHKFCNELVLSKICPNFPLIYGYSTFYGCNKDIKNTYYYNLRQFKELNSFLKNREHSDKCICLFIQKFDGNITQWFKEKHSYDECLSMLFQVWVALTVLNMNGIYHTDPNKYNILYRTIPSGGHWKYQIYDKIYYIPNFGHQFAITDFGGNFSDHFNITELEKFHIFNNYQKDHNIALNCTHLTNVEIISLNLSVKYNFSKLDIISMFYKTYPEEYKKILLNENRHKKNYLDSVFDHTMDPYDLLLYDPQSMKNIENVIYNKIISDKKIYDKFIQDYIYHPLPTKINNILLDIIQNSPSNEEIFKSPIFDIFLKPLNKSHQIESYICKKISFKKAIENYKNMH